MRVYDLLIKGGTIVDGSGAASFVGDVGILDGTIADIGRDLGSSATEVIEAHGLMVTPGFVDIHTHYDGQVTWEQTTLPSANHGVTTIVTGNCGVGFAPCKPQDRKLLVEFMEGVEDIPEVVMDAGLDWNWESFPDFLDRVGSRPRDIDTAALLPHTCLRVYVMGQRGVDREEPTEDDLDHIRALTSEAIRAGAVGIGTSRTLFHKSSQGVVVPSKTAGEAELMAMAAGMRDAGGGVFQAVIELHSAEKIEAELDLLHRVGASSGQPVTFSLIQMQEAPDAWRRALDIASEMNTKGVNTKAQVFGRPTGMLLGLGASANPFVLHPTYRKLRDLSVAEKFAEMRKPEVRQKILSEEPTIEAGDQAIFRYLNNFDVMFPLGDPPVYDPTPEASIGAQARRLGIPAPHHAYDLLLADEGGAFLYLPFTNFHSGTLDVPLAMMKHPHSILGLGDGGAHCGLICDAGYPTFMLTYWTRDRTNGERLPVEQVIRWLSHDTARTIKLNDRGLIATGYKADINIIDYERLTLGTPRAAFDLPADGRRLVQDASGYVATIVSGQVTYRNGSPTGVLPGRLVRGAASAPADVIH